MVLLLIGDLHETTYGDHNADLVRACADVKPDLILCPGDMLTAGCPERMHIPVDLLAALAGSAPVFMSPGNHETKIRAFPGIHRKYMQALRKAGVHMLANRGEEFAVRGNRISLTGLELPVKKYRKLRVPRLSAEELKELIGEVPEEGFRILLAHNPAFTARYLSWGADLTVCGHYHGGIMRLSGNRCLVSPYGLPFPKYGYGLVEEAGSSVIITSGLGDHGMPLRINDPTEIVVIRLKARRTHGA